MRVQITQFDVPPPIQANVGPGLIAQPGGQAGALPLPARFNIVTNAASGTAVRLVPILGQRQEVFARAGVPVTVYPAAGTAIEGFAVNIPIVLPDGATQGFTFDGASKWLQDAVMPGPSVNGGTITNGGSLELIRSDGSTVAVAGTVVGPAVTAAAVSGGSLSLSLSNDTTVDVSGSVVGPAGANGSNGVSVVGAAVTGGTLQVLLSSGQTLAAGSVIGPVGPTGAVGPSINSGTVNAGGTLSLVRSDGSTIAVSGTIVGAPGAAGAAGATGPAGPSINSGTVNAGGTLSLIRSDGSTIAVSGTIVGAPGAAGAAGATGPAGPSINSGTVNAGGTLSLVRSDGSTIAVSGTIVGAPGATGAAGATGPAGPSINSGTVNAGGTLSLVRSDGSTIAVSGTIVGATGAAGVGVTSAAVSGGTLTLLLSNSTSIVATGSVTPSFGQGLGNTGSVVGVFGSQSIAATAGTTIATAVASGLEDFIVQMPTGAGTVTLAMTPTYPGQRLMTEIHQGSTGGVIALNSGFVFTGSAASSFTLTPTAGAIDRIGWLSRDGTHWVPMFVNQGATL